MSTPRHPVEQAIIDAATSKDPVSEQTASVLLANFPLFAQLRREEIARMVEMQKAIPGLKMDIPTELSLQAFHGYSALAFAAKNNQLKLAKALIDAGADRSDRDALRWAAEERHQDMVHLLIQAKFNLDSQSGFLNRNALIIAASAGSYDIASLLIDAKADLNRRDAQDDTALMCAAWKGHKEIVQALINAGANLEVKDLDRITALDAAIAGKHSHVVRLLLRQGAHIQYPDKLCQFLQSCDQTNPFTWDILACFQKRCEQSKDLMLVYRQFFPDTWTTHLYLDKLKGLHVAFKDNWFFLLNDAISLSVSKDILGIIIGYLNDMIDYSDKVKDIAKLPPVTFLQPNTVDVALLELKTDMLKKAERLPGFFTPAIKVIHNALELGSLKARSENKTALTRLKRFYGKAISVYTTSDPTRKESMDIIENLFKLFEDGKSNHALFIILGCIISERDSANKSHKPRLFKQTSELADCLQKVLDHYSITKAKENFYKERYSAYQAKPELFTFPL